MKRTTLEHVGVVAAVISATAAVTALGIQACTGSSSHAHKPAVKTTRRSSRQAGVIYGHLGSTWNIVLDIDVTKSVGRQFTAQTLLTFASFVQTLAHDGGGRINIYIRMINGASGADGAGIATFRIPAVPTCEANPFDLDCRNAHATALDKAQRQANAIAAYMRRLHLKQTDSGTIIRGALAAASEILDSSTGDKWLIVASDLRPSHETPPFPAVDLHGVHVVVLYACREAIATCQTRQLRWQRELTRDGAASVRFLTAQQGDLLSSSVKGS